MSIPQAPKVLPTKPRKDRERERKEKEKQNPPGSERLKTVVRRLPPNLPEAVFWQSVEAWVTDQTVTWKAYYSGKFRKRLNKENIPSRAYIAFKTEEQLALFGREYDGHLFKDKAGNESHAIVEFAPYQKVPSEKKKPDARNATIENDEDYISFLNALNAPASAEPVSIETLVAAIQHPPLPKTTPLLEALKAEKSAHKDKESILRNHAHYKDQQAGVSSTPRKDDPKKKGVPIPPPKVAPTPTDASNAATAGVSSGKRSHKKGQTTAANAVVATLPPIVAQKPTAQINAAGKNANAVPVPGLASKSPKVSRAPRLPPQTTVPVPAPEVPIVALPAHAHGPPPRRPRPVVGLGSRHFEAALSGAGVSAPGDQKSRRDREREREKEKEKESPSSVTSSGLPVPAETKPTNVSPRRDRGRKESAQAHASGAGAAGRTGLPALALGGGPLISAKPGILQRDEPPAPGVAMPQFDLDSSVTVPAQDTNTPLFYGGRGGRRGRGKAKGARGG